MHNAATALARRMLPLVRRGPRMVVFTNPAMGWGNDLYQFMLADTWRAANPQTFVRALPKHRAWLRYFPGLDDLTLQPAQIRFTDRRSLALGQTFGDDFSLAQLQSFCRRRLLSSGSFRSHLSRAASLMTPETVTVNVRRGDYYGTAFTPEFGMRIVPYLDAALARHARTAPPSRIQVVSDDLDWCRDNLQHLRDIADVSFDRLTDGPAGDLAVLAASHRLVLANSTFSYWGAYLAVANGSAEPADIIAPGFHQRALSGSRPRFHDPRWTVISSLDGGWQPREQ